jgi:MFS family permease
MNLINYADRFLPSAVQPLYQKEFGLTDFQTALPVTVTILAFMLFALFFGFVSDSNIFDRRILMFTGVLLWSVTSALAALSTNLTSLIITRIFVGVGEAAYGTIGKIN